MADGVGGGPSGDLASAVLVHRLVAGHGSLPDSGAVVERLRLSNWDLRALAERDPRLQGMATTFTGLFVGRDGHLLLVHAGDSRAYLLRNRAFTRRTRDDSYVQALVDRGLLAPEAAATHPRRNIITASFGGAEHDLPGVLELEGRAGDRWLLCSDGLTDYVPEAAVEEVLAMDGEPVVVARAIVALALDAGTRDNVTAIVCDVVEGSPAQDQPVFAGSAAERFTEGLETA